jgi:hypothetical protein
VKKTFAKLRQGNHLGVKYEVKGKPRYLRIFAPKDLKRPTYKDRALDQQPNAYVYTGRTEIVQRLNAEQCEYCGQSTGYFEVHHVRKLRDIKNGKHPWEKIMIAMQRKTLVLCNECHDLLHRGTLPDWRRRKLIGGESRIR